MKKLAKEGCWSTVTKDIKYGLNYKFNPSIGKTLQKILVPYIDNYKLNN